MVIGSAAVALVGIHPYELSYYNELIGGPRGAWREDRAELLVRRFQSAGDPRAECQAATSSRGRFFEPEDQCRHLSGTAEPGTLRPDIIVIARQTDLFPYVLLLTQDSKATALTRLMFAMRPWYASEPHQLNGARVASVIDPVTVSRAWALQALLDGSGERFPAIGAGVGATARAVAQSSVGRWTHQVEATGDSE